MKITLISIFSLLVFILSFGVAQADIYKYIDRDGVLHFTNVPVKGGYTLVMRESRSAGQESTLLSYDKLIGRVSRRYGMDPALIKAVIKAESDFDPVAVSAAGAVGLMQLMPETARDMGIYDRYDPTENIDAGVRYLRLLLTNFDSNLPLALAAYNAGLDTVRQYGDIPPFKETRGYIRKVLKYKKLYSGGF